MRFRRAFAPLLCLAALAAGGASVAQTELTLQTVDGPRHALLYPAGPGPHPTVLVLHGHFGTAAQAARDTGFVEAARARGFTTVFADGLNRGWNDGRAGGPAHGPDDVAFLGGLAKRLVATGVASPGRIYLAGISNGGMMSFTLACESGGLFAGVGAVISEMPAGLPRCDLHAQPLLMIDGTADPMVPFAGGGVGLRGGRGQVLGAMQTAERFAKADGCAGETVTRLPHRDPADPTRVEKIAWTGCRPGDPVVLYRVEGGGHAYPGRPPLAFGLLGPSNRDLAPADLILDAFAVAR